MVSRRMVVSCSIDLDSLMVNRLIVVSWSVDVW
jgi:hypothetical protein